MPLRERIEFTRWLCFFPALTVMLFLRRNIGNRLNDPLSLLGVTVVMFVFAELARNTPYAELLQIFAVLVFFVGLMARANWSREFRSGVRRHSYYVGDSYLEFAWLPAFLRRERRIQRFVDPAVAAITGLVVWSFCPALGFWITFSGLCLRFFEDAVYRKQIERNMDLVDSMIEAEVQEEVIEQYSVRIHNPTDKPVNGIPTGCSADIQKTILRRTKRTPPHQ